MEFKWFMIAIAVTFSTTFSAIAIEKYGQGQCRIAAIQAGKNSTEIATICK
jgi:hypothetical protein